MLIRNTSSYSSEDGLCFKSSYDLGCIELKGLFSHRNIKSDERFAHKAHLIH